jgi:hypothetical protein
VKKLSCGSCAAAPRARGTCFLCRWRASPAKHGRRADHAISGPTPRLRSACVAPISTRSVEGEPSHSLASLREPRSSRSDSGTPRCPAWSRSGHPRREASGTGGGRGDVNAHFILTFSLQKCQSEVLRNFDTRTLGRCSRLKVQRIFIRDVSAQSADRSRGI